MKLSILKIATFALFLSLIGIESEIANAQKIKATHWYRISVPNSKSSIDVPRSSKTEGEKLGMYNYFGTSNQMFRFQPTGTGTYYIINKNSEKALAVQNASKISGSPIVQATIGARRNDEFYLKMVKPNQYALVAFHSRLPISISNSSLVQKRATTLFELKEVAAIPQNEMIKYIRKMKMAKNPGGTIRVFCEAGYLATFTATWIDENGKRDVWSSGKLSAGRRASKKIPALSRNVTLRAVMHSLKDSDIFSVKNVDYKKEYKVYGTIFKPKWTTQ